MLSIAVRTASAARSLLSRTVVPGVSSRQFASSIAPQGRIVLAIKNTKQGRFEQAEYFRAGWSLVKVELGKEDVTKPFGVLAKMENFFKRRTLLMEPLKAISLGPVFRNDLAEIRECISIAEREGHAAALRTLRSRRTSPARSALVASYLRNDQSEGATAAIHRVQRLKAMATSMSTSFVLSRAEISDCICIAAKASHAAALRALRSKGYKLAAK